MRCCSVVSTDGNSCAKAIEPKRGERKEITFSLLVVSIDDRYI